MLGAALVLGSGAPRPAAASADSCEKSAECAAHSEKGRALYATKKYDEALTEYQTAYRISHEPLLLLNQGRCYHRLGHPQNALSYYHRYQKLVPAPEPKVREALDRYEAIAGKPFYKTWWFWTATGGAAAIILGVGLGVGLSNSGQQRYIDFVWR